MRLLLEITEKGVKQQFDRGENGSIRRVLQMIGVMEHLKIHLLESIKAEGYEINDTEE